MAASYFFKIGLLACLFLTAGESFAEVLPGSSPASPPDESSPASPPVQPSHSSADPPEASKEQVQEAPKPPPPPPFSDSEESKKGKGGTAGPPPPFISQEGESLTDDLPPMDDGKEAEKAEKPLSDLLPMMLSQDAVDTMTQTSDEPASEAADLEPAVRPEGAVSNQPPPTSAEEEAALAAALADDEKVTEKPKKDGSDLIDHHGLPKVIYHPNSHADVPISRLPVIPPLPEEPVYLGFDIPKGTKRVQPDGTFADPVGTLIQFKPLTDELGDREDKHLHDLIEDAKKTNSRFSLVGFGDALSSETGIDVEAQSREIAFGLLRAQAVATRLIQMGVDRHDISISGEALGDGVRVRLEPK